MFDTLTRMGSSAAGAYEIERSLRFNSADSPYLTWTPSSSGNQQVMTWSFWYKRSSPGGSAEYVITAFNGTNTDRIAFQNDDQLHIELKDGNATEGELHSKRLFRDPSAWYHIVVAFDTTDGSAANRCKAYVNNEQITDWDTENTIGQNYSMSGFNTASKVQDIGAYSGSGGSRSGHCDGYITELHFIDGQQLTPSSFGETDNDTGQWIPKKYAGTYGNEGYYLNFSDNSNTTATTLGKDSSGNGNNWTPNNLSVAAGTGNDSLTDTPTNNYATLNPIYPNGTDIAGTFAQGNLHFTDDGGYGMAAATMTVKHGKYYWEVTPTSASSVLVHGIIRGTGAGDDIYAGYDADGKVFGFGWQQNGHIYGASGTGSASGATIATGQTTYTTDDILGFACDIPNGTLKFYKGGTLVYTVTGINDDDWFPAVSSYGSNTCFVNFGQRAFSHQVTGYEALCTANLPEPTIKNGENHFGILEYTGNETASTINGLNFNPDLIINTARNAAAHTIVLDSVRGIAADKMLKANGVQEEGNEDGAGYGYIIPATGGFQHQAGSSGSPWALMNYNGGYNFINWCWKAAGSGSSNDDGDITSTVSVNATAGFSIVTYTGTGSNTDTVGHGLGVAPDWILIKRRTSGGSGISGSNWRTYHSSMSAGTSLELNGSGGSQTQTGVFDDGTTTTSSVFRPNDHLSVNVSGDTYVAYCWSSVVGYSKMGSYTGNANANGTFIYTGFRPAFVIIKRTSASASWSVHDNKRAGYNADNDYLHIDVNQAESDGSGGTIDLLSNGFKCRISAGTHNDGSMIYMAFAERPFKYANAR